MSMNLIALLVSLAMLLTGAGGAAQPEAQVARTLTLSNVTVSWNGETLRLEPQARIGVSTDGKKALYDFAVDLGDRTLLPAQLAADETGVTALSANSGVAVKVTAEAIEDLAARLEAQAGAAVGEMGEDNAQLLQFITEEYLPAYAGMLALATDPDQREKINAAGEAVFDRVIDRGEGTPDVLELEDERYDVVAYSYTLDAMQLAALSDAVYGEVPEFDAYYNALFKLYDLLPEASGLRGVESFEDLFARFGPEMRMDIEELRSEDGKVDQMNGTLTIDVNSLVAVAERQAQPEGEAEEAIPEGEEAENMSETEVDPEAVGDAAEGTLQVDAGGKGGDLVATTDALPEDGLEPDEAGAPEDEAPETIPEGEEAEDMGETEVDPEAVGDAAEGTLQVDAGGKGGDLVATTDALPEDGLEPEPEDVVEPDEADAEIADAPETPALEPIVMDLHSLKLPGYSESNFSCAYALDENHAFDLSMSEIENDDVQDLEATVILTEDGRKTLGGRLSAFVAHEETGAVSYSMSVKAIQQDAAKVDAVFYGVENPDGTSENSVAAELHTPELNAAVSFDLNVTDGAIEDATAAVEPVCVIDDLSEAGLQSLTSNPNALGALMRAMGSMTTDFSALTADQGLRNLRALVRGEGLPIDVDELDEADFDVDLDFGDEAGDDDEDYGLVIGDDGEYELVLGEGDETAFDFDDEPVEDDGVLAFAEPRLTWLPKGWAVTDTETDTAYDWVQMSITDADGVECAYAIFFQDPEAETANYIVQESGKVVDGRMMNVTDFGEGGLSVTVSEDGMYGNLMFNSEAIELDTIGRIVAGIAF